MATERRPRPGTADEIREMWAVTQGRWESTLGQAGALPEDAVHERVGDEWSFVETLRHLVFVHDAWVARALLDETAYHPLGLPPTAMKRRPPLPGVLAARPAHHGLRDHGDEQRREQESNDRAHAWPPQGIRVGTRSRRRATIT